MIKRSPSASKKSARSISTNPA